MDAKLLTTLQDIITRLGTVVRGKQDVIELLLVGVLSAGHVLIEDVPGVGKTTLAKALARVFDVSFRRIQFTPDLLPADIIGTEVLNPADGTFSFHQGPVFTNVLLADEINRASPRTQSALLEAMNEGQVTVEGVTRPLPKPFLVVATQNPVDFQGTYPLPEAQLDRFLLRLKMGYPSADEELKVLTDRRLGDPMDNLEVAALGEQLLALQEAVRQIEVKDAIARYILELAGATRSHRDVELGVSTRGALGLFRAAQAHAFLRDRGYITPDDVQALAVPTMAHRMQLTQTARYGGGSAAGIVRDLVKRIAVPT